MRSVGAAVISVAIVLALWSIFVARISEPPTQEEPLDVASLVCSM